MILSNMVIVGEKPKDIPSMTTATPYCTGCKHLRSNMMCDYWGESTYGVVNCAVKEQEHDV